MKERTAQGLIKLEGRETHDKALERRLHLEEMLSDLSARFSNLPDDQVDAEIENALRQIRDFFQADLCALLEVQEDKAFVRVSHAAYGEGVEPVPGDINLVERYPWTYGKLMRGEQISISREEDYHEEALTDRQSYAAMGTTSMLAFPVALDGRITRAITIHQIRRQRTWPEEYVPRLRLLGEILVNALERRQDRVRMGEQLRFEMLLAEISGRFVNIPADRVDSEIEDAQRRVCQCLGLDVSSLWQWSKEMPRVATMTHIYWPLGSHLLPNPMHAHEHFPWCQKLLEAGEMVVVSCIDDVPAEAAQDKETYRQLGIKTVLTFPLSPGGGPIIGALGFNTVREERTWPEDLIARLQLIAQIFANALSRKQAESALRESEEQLQERLKEIEGLRERLERENVYLREETKLLFGHDEIVGDSRAIKKVLAQARQVAATDSTVLILGETGTGKELIARAIHDMSRRKDRTLVTVNCASLPPNLIESELFGREKGAYTGALTRMAGRFEAANGSTLFLDEIGDLPFEVQSKLLRVLEQGIFERLGSTRSIQVDVRIMAATNRDLSQDVREGKFRKDLYYRLNVFPVTVPPLRERTEDIPSLVWSFVKQFEKSMGKRIDSIPKANMAALARHGWPGNIRELRNVIEHAMILSSGRTLDLSLPEADVKAQAGPSSLEDMERRHIFETLERTNWRISGTGSAAELLGMKRTTLQSKMKVLGITRPQSS